MRYRVWVIKGVKIIEVGLRIIPNMADSEAFMAALPDAVQVKQCMCAAKTCFRLSTSNSSGPARQIVLIGGALWAQADQIADRPALRRHAHVGCA